MKVLAGTFNQEEALEGSFSVNVKTLPMVGLQLLAVVSLYVRVTIVLAEY